MSAIKVLPEILVNKIAAGEIVERPASVVKELVENSLDAGAQSIYVAVEAGGRKEIVVRDDGEGMSQDDAILAFEHHATSKLEKAEDLAAIATLGFRGEALPSIASISRLTLRTKHYSDSPEATGSEVQIQGGKIRTVKPIAWDRGSEVWVSDLFFNLPARRKFLRSHQTELGHIARLVTHYALARPEVRFTLVSEGRNLIDVVAVTTLKERIYQLFGDEYLDNLVEISGRSGLTRVTGFASKPHEQRTNPYSQFFYVNRRMVRDKVISSAVRQAYRDCMPSSAYPVALVFVELPYDQVDVNAHPAKIEIRFRQQSLVHDLVRNSMREALMQARSIAAYEHREEEWSRVRSSPGEYTEYSRLVPAAEAQYKQTDHHSMKIQGDLLIGSRGDSGQGPFSAAGVKILGQIQDSYIVASDNDGLLIIDQHVAHERILYEKLARAVRLSKVESQGLLVPISVQLLPHQSATLQRIQPELDRNGFQVEPFGGNAVLVRSVPAIAKDQDCQKLLSEILEGIEREERTLDAERIRDRIAVDMACRAAIKVHTPLTMEKMQWLLDELTRTRIPTNCPHGRPIILRFSLYEIERNFGRS